MKLKPINAFSFILFTGLLFMAGAFMFTADRAVQAEYSHRAQTESVIASRIAQYEAARAGESQGIVNGSSLFTAVLALTVLLTAVNGFMGKDGLTGVLRQLNRMKPKRSRPHPMRPSPVNAPALPALPASAPVNAPMRELNAFTAVPTNPNRNTREGGDDDAIQWT